MGRPKGDIEIIARGVIVGGGRVLLARRVGGGNAFLPGGHVEWNEPARTALGRELWEELGLRLKVALFLGCVEHAFGKGKKRTHELNLLFAASGRVPGKPASREGKLEFFWQPMENLGAVDLQPYVLRRLLPELVKKKRPVWGGTME